MSYVRAGWPRKGSKMTSPSTFHYSPYLVDSAAKPSAWVATAGQVISYGIPSPQAQAGTPAGKDEPNQPEATPAAPLPTEPRSDEPKD